MKSIGITELKKQAKLLRKNNNNIKNHSESLDLIAIQYNFKKWDDLINHSSLILNHSENNDLNNIFSKILSDNILILNDFKEAFESNNHTYLYQTFCSIIFKNKLNKNEDLWEWRGHSYLEFVCYMYNLKKDKKTFDLTNILVADVFADVFRSTFSIEDVKKDIIIRRFSQNHFFGYDPFEKKNNKTFGEKNHNPFEYDTFKEQFGMAVLTIYKDFNEIVNLINSFMNLSEKEIIKKLKIKENAQLFFYNPIVKKEYLSLYQELLLGREVPFLNHSFYTKHLDFMNELIY
jgi:hypothetical protein